MKDNKLVEKYDDNPGAYFGMLVECWEDVRDDLDWEDNKWLLGLHNDEDDEDDESLKEQKEITREEKIKAISSNPKAKKQAKELTDKGELPFNSIVDFVYADFFGKDESLKEDKFVSRDKMSKKDRKELDSQKRNTWGNTNPVTRVQPNKKAYDRKRDKKVVDESLTEDSDVFKDMSSALDDIEYLCNDTYNWDINGWNDKENVRRTAERIIESAQVLLDSIKKY